jgi:type IV pilus assembly protein PilM
MSDLVVTNGYRVWNRTINLGGSHFTKALTKQMKLTFAKAEHLKRNAMKAEDPKAVFQAMRPTFGELLGEVQRSLSFFQNLDRSAKLGRVVALGNAMKLRGLHKYLLQNLGLKVDEVDSYKQLTGPAVVSSPAFKDNILSFAVCYGLAVQALGKGKLNTNLLPPEILKERMIREKKPWAVAAVATLLLGCTIGFFGQWREWDSAYESDAFKKAFSDAQSLQQFSNGLSTAYEEAKTQNTNVVASGKRIASIGERRIMAAEMMKAVTECLPRDPDGQKPEKIEDRNEVHIESFDIAYVPDLKPWFESIKEQWERDQPKPAPVTPPAAGEPGAEGDGTTPMPMEEQPMETPPADGAPPAVVGPEGPGWVVRLVGYHYHNHAKYGSTNDQGPEYVRKTLLTALREKDDIVVGPDGTKFSMKELGIDYPVLVTRETRIIDTTVTNPNAVATATPAAAANPIRPGAAPMAPMGDPGVYPVRRYDFEVQFIWKPTPMSERLENRQKKQEPPKEQPELASQ